MIGRILAAAAIGFAAAPAHAAIISVSGPDSSVGTSPAIIGAPSAMLDDIAFNTGMQGFNEAQGVVTSIAYAIDGGTIAAGSLVNSHMIFLNPEGGERLSHRNVQWLFDEPIVGVMSDGRGMLEAASSAELGAPGTNYTVTFTGSGAAAPLKARGFEPADSYLVSGNLLKVSMRASEPGDWIRVVTGVSVQQIPLPASLPLAAAGVAGLGLLALRRRRDALA
jgi:hypothetical protein